MSTGGTAVARVLVDNGVSSVFTLLGNQTVSTAEGLHERGVDVVSARHEYNAAVMADTHGRLTGNPGVALTVAGPGATNALTGVAQAYTAASPMVCISAVLAEDAPTEALHGVDDPHFLETAFEPATKWSTQVHTPERIPGAINRGFEIATSGRPGPVFIGIEDAVLMNEVDVPDGAFEWDRQTAIGPDPDGVGEALSVLTQTNRRALYVGKGVSRAFAWDGVVEIAESLGCPVVCPRHYPDSFPNDHELFAGTVGMSDHPAATTALEGADAVLSIGVRPSSHEATVLGDRAGTDTALIYLHAGSKEHPQTSTSAVVGGRLDESIDTARRVFERETEETADDYLDAVHQRSERVRRNIAAYLDSVEDQTPIHPLLVMAQLREVAPDDVIVTGDAGAAGGAWPNDVFEYRTPNTFQHSRLYDSMGFPVPAGNAAKLVDPDRAVVNLIGDGGFLMCNMELATAVATDTDAVTVVMNDAKYGMIWNYQRESGHSEVATDIPAVNIAAMAEAFGVCGIRVEDPDDVKPALESALAAEEHVVVDIVTDPAAEYVSRKIW